MMRREQPLDSSLSMQMVHNKKGYKMFGIIDENKKFILLDDNRERLKTTALILAKEEIINGETHYVHMFTQDDVDAAIVEYNENDIETASNGDKYLNGFAPTIE